MVEKTDSFDDYNDDLDYDEINDGNSPGTVDDQEDNGQRRKSSAWREIEEFWDNYEIVKQVRRDSNNEYYYDYLLDGELN